MSDLNRTFVSPVTFTPTESALVYLALSGQLPRGNDGEVYVPRSRTADYVEVMRKLDDACTPVPPVDADSPTESVVVTPDIEPAHV